MSTLPFDDPAACEKEEKPSSLRQQRYTESPRHRSRLRRMVSRRVFWLYIFGPAAAAGAAWGAIHFLLSDPRFYFRSVHVQQHRFVASSQIEDKFRLDQGRSILRIPIRERREEIEQIPWVRSATVTRAWPDQLWVTIVERVPVAFVWTADGLSLVDGEGAILELPPDASFTFPVIRGVAEQESASDRRSKMQVYGMLLEELDRGDARLREEISEVDLADPEDVQIVVADGPGTVLLHLGKENFLSRYLVFASHVSQWRRQFANLRSVDLRFDGQAVINADGQRTATMVAGDSSSHVAAPPASADPGSRSTEPGGRGSSSQ